LFIYTVKLQISIEYTTLEVKNTDMKQRWELW